MPENAQSCHASGCNANVYTKRQLNGVSETTVQHGLLMFHHTLALHLDLHRPDSSTHKALDVM